MPLVAGAYPCYFTEPSANQEFLSGLGMDQRFSALELPVRTLKDPVNWPAGAPGHWDGVLTLIPATMAALETNPDFGLASTSEQGRRAAVDFTRHVLRRAQTLKAQGHQVIAVELHSAPRQGSDPQAFAQSLSEIASWKWGETILAVEHCDARRPGVTPQKGFLELAEEIDVIRSLPKGSTRVGVTINWARSVIETRAAEAGQAHLVQTATAGVLVGLMFSSVSAQRTSFGPAWVDAHLAPAGSAGTPESSVLTSQIIKSCLEILPPDSGYLGFKVGVENLDTPDERVQVWRGLADLIDSAKVA